MEFIEVANALSLISVTGSTLQKEELLRRYADLEGFKDVLRFIYDPYFTTGLKQAKLDNAGLSTQAYDAEGIMEYLKKYSTGTMFDATVANSFIYSEDDEDWRWAATGLVTKDLQIGISVTTLNKVYGKSFIPKIGIMRGMLCPDDAQGIYIVTEKIDGNRRIIMNKETGVEIYTRSGKRDKGLVDIEREAAECLPKGFVYDCECVATGDYVDSIALRQASASLLNRRNQKRTGVRALCFDVMRQEEYDAGYSRMGALARKAMAAAMTGEEPSCEFLHMFAFEQDMEAAKAGKATNYANSVNALISFFNTTTKHDLIIALPILGIAHNKQDGRALAEHIWETGGEGVMMVEWNSAYEVNPNPRKTLLKIKMLREYNLKCTGVFSGDAGHKYDGTLGGIYVEYPCNGQVFKVGVGSGFTDWHRDYYWSRPDAIVGKVVEIESFGESQNAQGGFSINCPIFKRIKGEKE